MFPAELRPYERTVQQYDQEGHHYAHMSVKEIMMGTQEKIDIDQLGLRVKVSEHARVRFDEDSHSFVYVVIMAVRLAWHATECCV